MTRRSRYSRKILQFEANRWSCQLKERGYQLPDARITVYTSGLELERGIGHPIVTDSEFIGMAHQCAGGTPVVFVRLPRGHYAEADPLEVLIHELLHHVTPELSHEDIFRVASEFRREDGDALLPAYALLKNAPTKRPDATLHAIHGRPDIPKASGRDLFNKLFLQAHGYIKMPTRSRLTGRFVKPGSDTNCPTPARRSFGMVPVTSREAADREAAFAWRGCGDLEDRRSASEDGRNAQCFGQTVWRTGHRSRP